jgi:hypothetical protein
MDLPIHCAAFPGLSFLNTRAVLASGNMMFTLGGTGYIVYMLHSATIKVGCRVYKDLN